MSVEELGRKTGAWENGKRWRIDPKEGMDREKRTKTKETSEKGKGRLRETNQVYPQGESREEKHRRIGRDTN